MREVSYVPGPMTAVIGAHSLALTDMPPDSPPDAGSLLSALNSRADLPRTSGCEA
jgi:hypothetical protein